MGIGKQNLSGTVPPELGNLVNLERLHLDLNIGLAGPLPRSLLALQRLDQLTISGVCVPGTSEWVEWTRGIQGLRSFGFCNGWDRHLLTLLHDATGGPDWTNNDGWLGDDALSEWYGVDTDSLGLVTALDLVGNGLVGTQLPPGLRRLSTLRSLKIGDNALSGRLPLDWTLLTLRGFHYADTGLCEPPDEVFQEWLEGIDSVQGTGDKCGDFTERDALEAFYHAMNGPQWHRADNWLTTKPLGKWYGVTTDDEGRVKWLRLSSNGLVGQIPAAIGHLPELAHLVLGNSFILGSFPRELYSLTKLRYLGMYNAGLTGRIPPELASLPSLELLMLSGNQLQGPIPRELADVADLEWLMLEDNLLTGPIPPELGNLANLEELWLWNNSLTGSIPGELSRLRLRSLDLRGNALTGPIPAEFGDFTRLQRLTLLDNALSGRLPPELGRLSGLEELKLTKNNLSGPVPPEYGSMESLRKLAFGSNRDLSGALPLTLTNLAELNVLSAPDTELCAPQDEDFLDWLNNVEQSRVSACRYDPDASTAYLVQAVQSREFPAPIVADEPALLRVFVTSPNAGEATMPPVRATFYVDNSVTHTVNIPAGSEAIPTTVDESSLARSANAMIPQTVVEPGLEMVIDIDPDGTLDAEIDFPRRIPETGRMALDVREVPNLDLTLVPFLWSENPDSSIIGAVDAVVEGDDTVSLIATRILMPVRDINTSAHEPVTSSSNNVFELLSQTEAIRVMEGGGGYFMGTMAGATTGAGGVAIATGWSFYAPISAGVIAHEIGHNFSLGHAPCGTEGDPLFPTADGSIGAWGYDPRNGTLVPSTHKDIMSYCGPQWISDYYFTQAFKHRLAKEGDGSGDVAPRRRSLTVWGGISGEGEPFLEPAFVVDAPPALPDSAGPYTLVGHAADGRRLFSVSFPMPRIPDGEDDGEGDGGGVFAFALPAEDDWRSLAGITLSGPDVAITLEGDGAGPMAILRDPRTGRIRAFLRGRDVRRARQLEPDLEVIFSSGIPDAGAWSR